MTLVEIWYCKNVLQYLLLIIILNRFMRTVFLSKISMIYSMLVRKKMEACKAGILNIPIYKRKASYNRSYQAKQIQTKAFAKSKTKKK